MGAVYTGAGSLVIFVAYMLQVQLQPFKQASLNWCESMGLRTVLFTLFCALALQAPEAGHVTLTQTLTPVAMMSLVCLPNPPKPNESYSLPKHLIAKLSEGLLRD